MSETVPDADRSSGTPADLPTVAAVVVNYDGGAERLNKTIDALLDQPFPLAGIVLVDGGSSDGSQAQAVERYPQVTFIQLNGNPGPCATRNAGVDAADADLVLLLDSDVYVDAHTIERMTRAMVEQDADVVCPRIRLVPERDQVQAQGGDVHYVGAIALRHGWQGVDQTPTTRETVQTAISACLLVEKSCYLDVGGFDELLFFYYEDLEFGLRTRLMGYDMVCEPTAEVFHERSVGTPGLSFRGKEKKYPQRRGYLQTRNRLIILITHYRLWSLIVLSPALLLYELLGLVMAATKGYLPRWFAAWGWVFANLPMLCKRRRAVQAKRKRADRDLFSGGPLPLAPGIRGSGAKAALIGVVATLLDLYWKLAKHVLC